MQSSPPSISAMHRKGQDTLNRKMHLQKVKQPPALMDLLTCYQAMLFL